MSIRSKTFLINTATLLLLFIVLYGALQVLLLSSYKTLEDQAIKDNVERATNAFASRLNSLSSTVGDWAYWDDAYSFVQGKNDAFVEANLFDSALATLDVNVMVFTNAAGEVVYKKRIDLDTGTETSFPTSLLTALSESGQSLDPDNLKSDVKGFIRNGDDIMMLAKRYVLTSYGGGPAAGTLLVGRYLDAELVAGFSDSLNVPLTIRPAADLTLLDERMGVDANAAIFSQPLDNTTIAGYTLLNDLQGEPIGLLELTMERSIYAQGQNAVRYFVAALLVIGVVFIFVTLWLIDRIVLVRLAKLSREVTSMRDTGNMWAKVPVTGQDELANLAVIFGDTMSALGSARDGLKRANETLEDQVAERTRDLEQANKQLKDEIVERKRAQNELKGARDQALEALQLKTQILANVSHDTRTPLSVISLRTEMMQTGRFGPLTDKQHEILNSIRGSTTQLLAFIENLLSGSQLDNNKMVLRPAEVAPSQLLASLSEISLPLAERKGLELKWSVAPSMPDEVMVDHNRFDQILQNLVTNAIKFTPSGSVQVRLYLPDAHHWALEVADTGIGIPVEVQARIFEAFWQIDGSLTRSANRGVGLGLSIVKQLTTLMNGELTLDSAPNRGSTFTVSFPLAQPQGVFANGTTVRVSG